MNELDLFAAAIAIQGTEERRALLDRECAGNPELRKRLERLVVAHFESNILLDQQAIVTVDRGKSMLAGHVIAGKYKLLEEIGEGGMGTVWAAEQTEPVRRKVALKLIKAGMDSRSVLARFEAERQALAVMDHPNIAKVFDGGLTDSGRPYFVMEYVKGVPITEYCDATRLSVQERLHLFVQVCQAVQHAHQKGIIHRDLKPSNILVAPYDDLPVPKVIDFGLAKAMHQSLTEKTLHTAHETVLGTPLYMSPEQAQLNNLDVDTRSDIYSLGVLLYELLTGTTPLEKHRYKKAAWDEVKRIIREEEPPRPSMRLSSSDTLPSLAAARKIEPAKLTKLVRGEIDWIVMKSLEKDRTRRYETASGFAADVQRYLAGEPVLAHPPSASYRLKKFVRRNRPQVLAASLVLLALVAGIIGTTLGLIEARRQEAEARRQAGIALAEATAKEQARAGEAAQRAIADGEKRKAQEAEAKTLASYRASTDDAIGQLIGSKPELGPQERAYLEKTLERWREFAQREGNDERSQAIRAEGHFRVALLWHKLGQRDAARIEYEIARDLRKKLAAAFPAVPQYQQDLANTRNNLGLLLADVGQRDAARSEFETARDVFKELTAAFPTLHQYQQELAYTHNNLGLLLADLGQRDAARSEFETARDIRKKLAAAFPAVHQYQQELAGIHNNLGTLLAGLGQRDAARTELETARDLQRKLAVAFPAVPLYQQELAYTHNNLGLLLADLGQRDAARSEFENARDIRKKLAAAFPAVPQYQEKLAGIHNNLGLLLAGLGQRDAARVEYETARDIRKKLAAAFPAEPQYQQDLARIHNNLGTLLLGLGQQDAARTEFETARDTRKKLVAAFPGVPQYQQELSSTHNNLGALLAGLGQRDAARVEYETARDLRKKLAAAFPAVPQYQQELAQTHNNLGLLLADLGQRDAARVEYEAARDLQRKLADAYPAVPTYQRERAATHNNLGTLLSGLGQRDAARVEYETARDLQKKLADAYPAVPQYKQELAGTHNNLGALLDNLGQREAARAEYETAHDLRKKLAAAFPAVPQFQVELGGGHLNFGILVQSEGKPADSLPWFELAIRTLTPVHEKEPRDVRARHLLRNSHWNRAISLDQLKQYAEAVKDWDRAIELSPPTEQLGLRARRANFRLQAEQVAEAVAEVAALTKSSNWSADQWYDFARVYSVASGKIEGKKQEYTDRAMELLQNAVKAGWKDASHMKQNTDLDPLRERGDFLKLLAELEKK